MTDTTLSNQRNPRDGGRFPGLLREAALGYAYWLVFLLVLEPDNVLKAGPHGLAWSQELIRILAASALGASATPLMFALVRRYPVEGPGWFWRAVIEIVFSVHLAALLIAVSCPLAYWLLASEHRSPAVALPQELQANWTLLTFAIGGLLTILHAARVLDRGGRRETGGHDGGARPEYVRRVPVKTRGRVTLVDLAEVDWIETQGNYLALHAGRSVHLIRESLTQFERRLDPARFVRIHRRTIVAMDRVAEVRPLGAGDALVKLGDGTELRLSRGYRDRLIQAMPQA